MKTLQTKLLIGLLPTLAILVGLGLWAIVMFYRLGGNIDVILRENYTSILAAEGMKEAIERMDSGLAVRGRRPRAARPRPVRRESPAVSRASEDRAGEHHAARVKQALAESLDERFRQYVEHADRFFALPPDPPERRAEVYFGELLPTFDKIRQDADEILVLNQENMTAMDRRARDQRGDVDPADGRRADRGGGAGRGRRVPI